MPAIPETKHHRVDIRLKQAFKAHDWPRDLLIVGPAGTGKTMGILWAIHKLCVEVPNFRVLVVRQTRHSLTESVMVTLERNVLRPTGYGKICSGQQRKNRSSYDYPISGSTIVLGGMDKPDGFLSTDWDLIYANEAIQLNEDAWQAVASRLSRPGMRRRFGFLIADTNPGDPSHWLKRRIGEGSTVLWDTTHKANPALFSRETLDWTDSGLDYNDQLNKLKGTRRKRLRDGLWAAGEGQWFESFTDAHVSTEAAFHPGYEVHLAVDSGVHTGAVWFQIRPGPIVTVFGDYYAFNKPAYQAGKEILAKTAKLGVQRISRGTTDPAGKASTPTGIITVGEYERAGLKLDSWPTYPGSVIDGLALIESFVSVDPPGILVHPDCQDMINAFANYKRAKRQNQFIDRPEDPAHPYEDIMDSLRGGLMDKFPEGRKLAPVFRRVPVSSVI